MTNKKDELISQISTGFIIQLVINGFLFTLGLLVSWFSDKPVLWLVLTLAISVLFNVYLIYQRIRDRWSFRILKAEWSADGGVADVTHLLRSKVSEGKLSVHATNEILERDPKKGSLKQLTVAYSHKGEVYLKVIPEQGYLEIP